MNFYKLGTGVLAIGVVSGAIWYVWTVFPRATPWEASGTVVILAQAFPEPGADSEHVFDLRLGDLALRELGSRIRLSQFTERVELPMGNGEMREVLTTSVHSGTYEGLSMTIHGTAVNRVPGEQMVSVPYQTLVEEVFLNVPFTVSDGGVVVIMLGFETTRALLENGEGPLYLPVIHAEVRTDASLTKSEEGFVVVRDGDIVHNTLFGMDWNGAIRKNFRAKPLETNTTPPVPVVETEPQDMADEVPREITPATSTTDEVPSVEATSTDTQ